MEDEKAQISQIKVEETPPNCPVCPPCQVPPKTKPGKAFLKVLFLFILALILAAVVLVGSGIKIIRKESLLDIWLARNQAPTPTVIIEPTPTPDPTADWETYTNEKYGFSIKYPTERIVIEKSQPIVEFIFSKDKSLDPLATISLRIDENTKNFTLKQWIDGDFENYPETLLKDIRREKTTLDGIEAEKIYLPGEGASWQVISLKNNRFYTLSINSEINPVEAEKNNWDYFNLMLTTFEFLMPTPTGTQTKGGLVQGTPVKIKSVALTTATGPLVIKGTVDSGWMFEGTMPVLLLDSSRNEIASGLATETTPGSWQTGKAVDFSVSLTFTVEATSGFLVFKNDNPSGLSENQKTFELPVKFAQR